MTKETIIRIPGINLNTNTSIDIANNCIILLLKCCNESNVVCLTSAFNNLEPNEPFLFINSLSNGAVPNKPNERDMNKTNNGIYQNASKNTDKNVIVARVFEKIVDTLFNDNNDIITSKINKIKRIGIVMT